MGLLESLTIGLGAALGKAVLKLWLHESSPILESGGAKLVDLLKKYIEDFETRHATEKLFNEIGAEVARRLKATIEIEFPKLPEHDRVAAVLAVAAVFEKLDLSKNFFAADLNAVRLEELAKPLTIDDFKYLGEGAEQLARLILREACVYAITLADKLPNFHVSATRELLKRTSDLLADLTRVLDAVTAMKGNASQQGEVAAFETRYRRALTQKLDRMEMFGLRIVGGGAREYGLSIAYVTLTSKNNNDAKSNDVDACLSGLKRVIIRGEAGSGKTTLMQWLAVRAAARDFSGALEDWNSRIPFYIRLRDYIEDGLPSPERFLEKIAPNLLGLMPPKWAHETLATSALLLVDGIDEFPAAHRIDFCSWLRQLIDAFPDAICVASSRPAALDADRSRGSVADRLAALTFTPISLEPMSLADSEELISHWHLAVSRDISDENKLIKLDQYSRELRGALRDRPAVRQLASNPLLCSMICALNWDRQQRLPDDRMELYRLALEMLIESRDADRQIRAAYLLQLDQRAKEDLLDVLAYWMLRNGYSEAGISDVAEQVSRALPRLGAISPDVAAQQVLQELLERSGVLRQPQHGVVDFIHRTFLEYMAARKAVNSGDIGFLVDKAREENWRETVVFAAGHAKGATRDKLIAELLKKQWRPFRRSSVEANVTAACCLETARNNLDPHLLNQLRSRAKELFPPRDFTTARLLAPAAAMDPTSLMGHKAQGESVVAACIRCAAVIANEEMLRVIESYIDCEGDLIDDEMILAWTVFNEDVYAERIAKHRRWGFLKDTPLKIMDQEAIRCVQILVAKGAHVSSSEKISHALTEFFKEKALSLDSDGSEVDLGDDVAPTKTRSYLFSAIGGMAVVTAALTSEMRFKRIFMGKRLYRHPLPLSIADAKRIASLDSLVKVSFGPCEPGVLALLAAMPNLQSMSFEVQPHVDLSELAGARSLEKLQLSTGVSSRSGMAPVELRPLDQLDSLVSLSLIAFSRKINMPSGRSLTHLDIVFPTADDIQEIFSYGKLESLYLHTSEIPQTLYLQELKRLNICSIISQKKVSIELPDGIEELSINAPEIDIRNSMDLTKLKSLTLRGVKVLQGGGRIFNAPYLRGISFRECDGEILQDAKNIAQRRGVNISAK